MIDPEKFQLGSNLKRQTICHYLSRPLSRPIKQNVQHRERMHSEKNQLDQIQYGRRATIIALLFYFLT